MLGQMNDEIHFRVKEIFSALTKPQARCTGAMCSISHCTCEQDKAENLLRQWLKDLGDCQCYACVTRGQGACDER